MFFVVQLSEAEIDLELRERKIKYQDSEVRDRIVPDKVLDKRRTLKSVSYFNFFSCSRDLGNKLVFYTNALNLFGHSMVRYFKSSFTQSINPFL